MEIGLAVAHRDGMAKLPRSIAIQLQSFQPAVSGYFLQPEELQLRQRMRGLVKFQEPYRPELTLCSCASGPVLDLVARERLPGRQTLKSMFGGGMSRERHRPARAEWAAVTSRRPVVLVLEKWSGKGRLDAAELNRGEMVEKELDRMIVRRSRKGGTDPDEREDLWMESVRRYQELERRERRTHGSSTRTRTLFVAYQLRVSQRFGQQQLEHRITEHVGAHAARFFFYSRFSYLYTTISNMHSEPWSNSPSPTDASEDQEAVTERPEDCGWFRRFFRVRLIRRPA